MAPPASNLLSRRVGDVLLGDKESWTRRMFELAESLRQSGGGDVYDLSLGNPSLEPPPQWKQAVVDVLAGEPDGMHRYMTNAGFLAVRAFVAERESARYGLAFDADDVTMTVGAAGALNVLFRAMLDPGDEVITPAPYFSEYEHYCINVGAILRPVVAGDGFALDPAALVSAVGPRTRIVLLNSPNNPTGVVYSAEALAELGRRLSARSDPHRPIFVVEDSPYRDLVHGGADAPSMLSHWPHTVLLTSHSKDLGLAGERIGYLLVSPRASERRLIARAAAFCNRVLGFVNAPALMQRVLPRVLADASARVDVDVYAQRCWRMAKGLRALGFTMPDPQAGFFLFPRLPEGLWDPQGGDVALTERLVRERTIVVPGTAFGVPGHLRLSMATTDESIDGALAAFSRVCADRSGL